MKKLQKILIAVMLCVLSIIPVHADNTEWVKDDAGVLTQEEMDALNGQIQTIADTSKVGIYIRLKPDMEGSASIEDYAETIYTGEDLGIGNDHDGLLLVMSFDQRDYDLAAYGSRANAIFTDHAKDQIEDEMLAYFRQDDWYDGLDAMLSETEYQLQMYSPQSEQNAGSRSAGFSGFDLFLLFGVPPLLALLIVWAIASRNKTKGIAVSADAYATGHLNLTRRQDIFTHVTRTVTHIPRNDDHGGTSVNSSGFSHSSGKF